MTEQEIAELLDLALQRPVAYHRAFAQIAGKASAAVMLSQAWYWTPRTRKLEGWFYKSRREWTEETGLTRTEQETARKRLIKLGVLAEELRGMPATMHFKVIKSRVISLLAENLPTERRKPCKQVGRKPANQSAEKPPSITESTTENTKEISAHARLMQIHSERLSGKIPDPAAQGAAIKWLLQNYTEAQAVECYTAKAKESRWRVSWLTVKSEIGDWLQNGKPKGNGKRYTKHGEEILEETEDYISVMGPDGTPSYRGKTAKGMAMHSNYPVEVFEQSFK